jgi:uncharacterized protein
VRDLVARVSADHHTHLFSREAADKISSIREFAPVSAADLIDVLDGDDVGAAVVLSVAYFFAMPDLGKPDPEALAAENDWTAEQVAQHPDRLVACCSVNPLVDGALDEIDRCADRFVGVKLHLANSDVDLRNADHIAAVGDVFECANAHRMVLVVHMRTRRPDYGRVDVANFIERVMARAPDVPVHIAHAAGWGGYDRANDAAFATFADFAARGSTSVSNAYFDVAITPLDDEPEDDDVTPPSLPHDDPSEAWSTRRFHALATHVRTLGMDRLLFGTDWPATTPLEYLDGLREHLPLRDDEYRQLLGNTAPWLPVAGAS